MKRYTGITWMMITALCLSVLAPILPVGQAAASGAPQSQESRAPTEWIIKWDKGAPVQEFIDASVIHYFDEDLGVTVASPREGTDPAAWTERWSRHEEVRYIQPNRRVEIHARPNDELLRYQTYLGPIQAEKAWDTVTANRSITIAIVDTGVDLDHPDLKSNLVPGYNLIDEKKPPEDDHGHGTSVAGVIAAAGNNRSGIAGILWNARIMPIKALEADGSGSEDRLGRGIKHAVDNGAKIVVLSLGLYKYSNYLQEIVDYAESKGVLLVAASGNDGEAVKYPAAYPTVLAVGGVDEQKRTEPDSNRGPEIDLVAPWRVYTTALGGGYDYNEGTSMAAPQAAAVAAMLLARHPDWTPAQLRSQLRHTAEDIGPPGWDPATGYGLLRADQALSMPYQADPFEPNDTRQQAKTFAIDRTLTAELNGAQDRDWYAIPAPYDGELTITIRTPSAGDLSRLQAQFVVNGRPIQTFTDLTKPITVTVDRGTGYLEISGRGDVRSAVAYEMTSKFTIYRDGFEDNDRQFKAYTLPSAVQSLKGTFHQLNDQDWFVYNVTEEGTLQVKVSGDTYRMDLAIWLQREGEKALFFDYGDEGKPEISRILDVFPGKYYIRITNEAISQESHPVTGEYTLYIDYAKKLVDPNEPNNKAYQATVMSPNASYQGNFSDRTDEDWFTFTVKTESYVTLALDQIPADRVISMALLDNKERQLRAGVNDWGVRSQTLEQKLDPGTYYVKLAANQSITKSLYELKVNVEPLIAGFRDINGHWAQAAISEMSNKGIIRGYADYTFRPDNRITRAETAQILVNALGLSAKAAVRFTDLPSTHWAYDAVTKAQAAGLFQGDPGGTFRPDDSITRAEMAAIVARARQLKGMAGGTPFSDVPESHWALPYIIQLYQEEWLRGYQDGTFRPNAGASRAEFVSVVQKLVNRKQG
jgi:hypothetical protein